MAFNHRKLFPAIKCDYFCDSTRNTEGYCPPKCISECDTICHHSFPLFPPPDPPSTPNSDNHYSHNKPNNHLLLFLIFSLSIFATTCFIFCIYTLYKLYKNCYNSRRRPSQPQEQEQEQVTRDQFLDEDQGPMLDHPIWYIRTIGLQPSIINSITICKYKRGEGLVEGTECSVCLSEFQEDETLRLLPKCNHAFHIPCIDTWLRSHTNCPMCRAGIVSNMGNFPVPPTEQRADINPVVTEEAQVVVSESSGELREDGDCELGTGTEEVVESWKEEVVESDHLGVDEIQPTRRSVSMDCVSATMISVAIANAFPGESAGNSSTQLEKVNKSNMGIVPKKVEINQGLLRLVGSSSIGRSLQRGPLSLKRSLSCSGKVLLSRYARSRNSNLPS